AKLAALKRGLNITMIKDLRPRQTTNMNFRDFVRTCQEIANEQAQFAIQFPTPSHNSPSASTRPLNNTCSTATNTPPTPSVSTTAIGTHAGPMDLSAGRRRLSPKEHALRMREGRCMYCDGLVHMAAACPVAKRPLCAAETRLIEGSEDVNVSEN